MGQTRVEEFLQDYPKLQEAVEILGDKLTKAEKQIYALEEGLADLARHLKQLEKATESSGH